MAESWVFEQPTNVAGKLNSNASHLQQCLDHRRRRVDQRLGYSVQEIIGELRDGVGVVKAVLVVARHSLEEIQQKRFLKKKKGGKGGRPTEKGGGKSEALQVCVMIVVDKIGVMPGAGQNFSHEAKAAAPFRDISKVVPRERQNRPHRRKTKWRLRSNTRR